VIYQRTERGDENVLKLATEIFQYAPFFLRNKSASSCSKLATGQFIIWSVCCRTSSCFDFTYSGCNLLKRVGFRIILPAYKYFIIIPSLLYSVHSTIQIAFDLSGTVDGGSKHEYRGDSVKKGSASCLNLSRVCCSVSIYTGSVVEFPPGHGNPSLWVWDRYMDRVSSQVQNVVPVPLCFFCGTTGPLRVSNHISVCDGRTRPLVYRKIKSNLIKERKGPETRAVAGPAPGVLLPVCVCVCVCGFYWLRLRRMEGENGTGTVPLLPFQLFSDSVIRHFL
jgi:hypothetical protein